MCLFHGSNCAMEEVDRSYSLQMISFLKVCLFPWTKHEDLVVLGLSISSMSKKTPCIKHQILQTKQCCSINTSEWMF